MRKKLLKAAILLSVVGGGQLLAVTGELRTPLARFPYHYPLVHVDDWVWSFNTFANCYCRTADKGFGECSTNSCCGSTCNGAEKTVSLAELFFGKASFKAEEIFYGGSVAGAPAALKYVDINPNFKYSEKGANFGAELEYRFEDSKWRVGGCASIPFKVIEAERNACSVATTDRKSFEQNLIDAGVLCRKLEILDLKEDGLAGPVEGRTTKAVVPAYRLDFLSSLCRAGNMPMVEYGESWVRVAGVDIAKRSGAGEAEPALVAIKSENGTCPAERFSNPTETIAGPPGVPGTEQLIDDHWVKENGDIANDSTRGAFVSNEYLDAPAYQQHLYQDYTILGENPVAQAKLYLVPVYESYPSSDETNTQFLTESVIVMNAIEDAINDLEEQGASLAEQYFLDNDVHFCLTDKIVGLGDLKMDFFVGYDMNKDSWAKLLFGVVFPTGKKLENTGELLAQATGNNGHFEIMVGLQGGWKPSKWFALHLDAMYNHVFEATEKRAAAFKGATVKNIGPSVDARVKWGYFTGHADLTIFHPENQNLGFSLGYEAYVKRCDKINFCGCNVVAGSDGTASASQFDVFANCCTGAGSISGGSCSSLTAGTYELDASVMTANTKRISHKIRGSVFHRWDYCELFAGASRVIAGKNIMKESECHVGFGIYW